jgi:DnaK suppressor protein
LEPIGVGILLINPRSLLGKPTGPFMMTRSSHPDVDDAFIARQRDRLLKLRQQLIETGDAAGSDENALQESAGDEPQDQADDGDRLEQQANDEAVLSYNNKRVMAINRALRKIQVHTYGLSDGNGEPIDRAHLEAVPEAVYTAQELQQLERDS